MEGIENINKQIEKIDEKINMGNEIINVDKFMENDNDPVINPVFYGNR